MLVAKEALGMSQIPPPSPFQPPSNFPYPDANYLPPRPGVVSGLAITGIILGSLGVLCNGIGLVSLAMMAMGKNPFMPNAPVMHDPMVNGFGVVNGGVALLLSGSLLAFSIGALSLKPWAHGGAMRWSVLTLIWQTLAFIVQVVWILPITSDFVLKNQPQNVPPGMASSLHAIQAFELSFVWLLWCTLPVLFLILWRRPRVLAAFGKAPPEATDPMTLGPR